MTSEQAGRLAGEIRRRREAAAWTQEDLAAKSGVSPRTLQRAEKGEGLSKENVRALAEAFGIGAEELLEPASAGAAASYRPSRFLAGPTEMLRQRSFTRWMSPDLMQASFDFLKNLGLSVLYAEVSSEKLTRYLLWQPPQGSLREIRTMRSRAVFEQFDRINRERNWPLLSLHVNELDLYSAVWIDRGHYPAATEMLAAYGITPVEKE